MPTNKGLLGTYTSLSNIMEKRMENMSTDKLTASPTCGGFYNAELRSVACPPIAFVIKLSPLQVFVYRAMLCLFHFVFHFVHISLHTNSSSVGQIS